jgi:signal recognition particle subunit SRP14
MSSGHLSQDEVSQLLSPSKRKRLLYP